MTLASIVEPLLFAERVWSGEAGRDRAREMARRGRSGIVVEVRFPPDRPWRGTHRAWRSIRVTVDQQHEYRFATVTRRRSPREFELAPGRVTVAAVPDSLGRLVTQVDVRPGSVTLVTVHPSVTSWFVRHSDPVIEVGERVAVSAREHVGDGSHQPLDHRIQLAVGDDQRRAEHHGVADAAVDDGGAGVHGEPALEGGVRHPLGDRG
jgi:hypothetical protein